MAISDAFLYISLFVSLFFEIFLLITYFEIREEIEFERQNAGKRVLNFPSVTVIVPSFNEEQTVGATVESVLALDYPSEKLHLILIDDGSTDGTLKILNGFKSYPNVRILSKINEGSKFSALNAGLKLVETELVGCLDADSFVNPDALRRIVPYFENEKIMAVTPSIKIHEPKTFLQHIQKIEYSWGIFFRRMLASMNALYVTPGPFSIFRTQVFKKIGGYKHAHHTEDMEMALRMQKHGFKIANSHSAHVYTVGPARFKALYKQRLRWSYGFLNNAIDYKEMFFNRKYGNIGLFVLPIATFSIFSTLYAFGNLIWSVLGKIPEHVAKYQAVGFNLSLPHLSINWFALDTGMAFWITMTAVSLTLVILYLSLEVAEGKFKFSRSIIFYLTLYIFIVPLWQAKALYSTILRKDISWK